MLKRSLYFLAFLALFMLLPALAQGTAAPNDWGSFWATQGSLSALAIIVTAFLKERFRFTGVTVVIVSLVAGAALGALGKAFALYTGDWQSAILFGLGAGFLGSGGWDAVTGLLKNRPVVLPEAPAATAQVPGLALEGLTKLAGGFGIPGFVVSTLLSEHTFAEAERLIREMGKERALTEGEIKESQDEFEKGFPVVRNPAMPNTVVTKGGQK